MKNLFRLAAAAVLLAACGVPTPGTTQTAVQPTLTTAPQVQPTPQAPRFTDPFAYCTAVENIDAPDERYAGERIPPRVVDKLLRVYQPEDEAGLKELLQKTAFWRCMDGQVYACSTGANLPCTAKINPQPVITEAMRRFCIENPNQEVIPAAVTGRETAFTWVCKAGEPAADQQVVMIDPRGFDAQIWYRVSASQPAVTLTINRPLEGEQLTGPVIVNGVISQMPFEKNLVYRVTNPQGEQVLIGPISVAGEYGESGTFSIEIPFTPEHKGSFKIKIVDLSAEDGSLIASDAVTVTIQ